MFWYILNVYANFQICELLSHLNKEEICTNTNSFAVFALFFLHMQKITFLYLFILNPTIHVTT